MNIELLQNIPFGIVTGSVLIIVVILCVLALALFLVQEVAKVCLNSSHPKAPKYNWGNPILTLLSKLCSAENLVSEKFGGWVVLHSYEFPWASYSTLSGDHSYWRDSSIKNYCVHETKEDAFKTADKILKGFNLLALPYRWLFYVLAIDVILFLLPLHFFPVVTTTILGIMVFGVRAIAGLVYENTSNIGEHETRITKL